MKPRDDIFYLILRQRALTFSTLFGACLLPFLVVVLGFLPFPVPGAFLDSWFPLCRESTVLVIRNAPFSTGCFSIISSGSSPNTRAASSGTMVISGRSSKYMIRPVLSLERLSFLEPEGKVGYRYDQDRAEQEAMDYLEFIARVTSHIPDKGQVTIRYYGLYANAHQGESEEGERLSFGSADG